MEYLDFDVEDFILDESFQRFCIGRDMEASGFWLQFIKENPEKQKTIDEARRLYRILNGNINARDYRRHFNAFKRKLAEHTAMAKEPLRDPVWYRAVSRNWLTTAAAMLIFVTVGLLVYRHFFSNKIVPGTDQAMLTLANGQRIALGRNNVGMLASQGSISVSNHQNGLLQYLGGGQAIGNNSLSVPRGGQYQVSLPDGTHVWLNSDSQLDYPTAFDGKERLVKLRGEAFFEVRHDPAHPFVVAVDTVKIAVLGTSFNISAYPDDEDMATTVLSGLVGVTTNRHTSIIKPGQQAIVMAKSPIGVTEVDAEEVIAWKQGLFKFSGSRLSVIAKQLSRWYNVDIDVSPDVADQEMYGILSRSEEIDHVLEILEVTGHVNIIKTDHKILIKPKH